MLPALSRGCPPRPGLDLHKILHQFKLVNGEIAGQGYSFSSEARQQVQSPLSRLLAKSHFLVWLRGKLAVFDDLIELHAGEPRFPQRKLAESCARASASRASSPKERLVPAASAPAPAGG